ncbi:testicular acid phosphatase homolog [Bacillus rossius redtenbacheri]|uniref:testicular acid phosphatase homolog n=1 Tax=Bacillus rossius redtenbacheri TaxID=93214 RepID=UPI002FDE269D
MSAGKGGAGSSSSSCCHASKRGTCVTVSSMAFVIGLLLLAFYAFGDDTTLQVVCVVFRHGDRTPTETYPTDPYKNKNWQDGWGMLTAEGKRQMYTLGKYLRQRYDTFVSRLYSPGETWMESSANDRCLMSAQVLLAGLYPPTGHQVWNDELPWQPIPVHSTPRALDKLIVMKKPCPRYEWEKTKAYQTREIKQIDEENADLYSYLTQNTGKNISTILDVELLFNTLEIEEKNGLALPEWTKSVYPDRMKTLAAKSLAIFTHTPEMKKLYGGPLVKLITQQLSSKRSTALATAAGAPGRKLFLYSAHDVTLVSAWRTLGFAELLKPDYGAALMFEMHIVESKRFEVKLFYLNNTWLQRPRQLEVPNCGKPCSLDKFVDLMTPVLPDDWETECQM